MTSDSSTQSRAKLDAALEKAVRFPHKNIETGKLYLSPEVFNTPGRETNIIVSSFALLDCTGSIELGPWCLIGPRVRIYTHEHLYMGKQPLLDIDEQHSIVWQDKKIGKDVWINDGAVVLYQVPYIPEGVVIGAGAVLTKVPGPYEIWAGNPARKVGKRDEISEADLHRFLNRERYLLENKEDLVRFNGLGT